MPKLKNTATDLDYDLAVIRDKHLKNLKTRPAAEKIERIKRAYAETEGHIQQVLPPDEYKKRQRGRQENVLGNLFLDGFVTEEQEIRLARELGLIDTQSTPSRLVVDRAIDLHLKKTHGFSAQEIAHIRNKLPCGTMLMILKDDLEAKIGRKGSKKNPWAASEVPVWKRAQKDAEVYVKKMGGRFPGRNKLATMFNAGRRTTMSKAIKQSAYLSARQAESKTDRGKLVKRGIEDVDLDRTPQLTEPDPQTLAELVDEQKAEEGREDHQHQKAKKRRR